MKTLKEFTGLLADCGARGCKMERSYKRDGHREVLIRGWITIEGNVRARRGGAKEFFAVLQAAGYELTFTNYSPEDGEMWVQAKVALAEGF